MGRATNFTARPKYKMVAKYEIADTRFCALARVQGAKSCPQAELGSGEE